ncbi:MAG: phosphoribosylaminoimidazolesuccinocarboxamide synthase [Balneolaceae bacterium]|nr:phosphoribosylaminoimidazolesuccinocarboxamide synthase [Balneolaceae bacterium]
MPHSSPILTSTSLTSADPSVRSTSVAGWPTPYHGKVRDVYTLNERTLAIVVTDRISAFDHIMKQPIPYKGQILNQLASFGFDQVSDLVPTFVESVPHANVMIGKRCDPIPIEVVMRGTLTGHAWRVYRDGGRELCGVRLPEDMKEHQRFETPILTPATKAAEGHDEDISEAEILARGVVDPSLWEHVRETAFRLFARGQEVAAKQGLLLADTKYEFGLFEGELTLIDEIHTTDSSRFFYLDGYETRQAEGASQKQLSKEFLREWLIEHGFQGLDGQTLPDLPNEFRVHVFERYAEVFERMTGLSFEPESTEGLNERLAELFSEVA